MRLTFRRAKRELRSAVETMISWNPERVIFAHGHWYRANGTAELRRALLIAGLFVFLPAPALLASMAAYGCPLATTTGELGHRRGRGGA
jgi:hypothetical protein